MTYEEFKKALCRNVQNMETAQNKTIRLLERQMICSDPMAVHIMSVMNAICMEERIFSSGKICYVPCGV